MRTGSALDLGVLGEDSVLSSALADVAVSRERVRRTRLTRMTLVLTALFVWLWVRVMTNDPIRLPHLTDRELQFLPLAAIVILLGAVLVIPLVAAGRSPHVRFQPGEIDVSFDDVKGMPVVVEEVVRTLNLFLAHRTFREQMGGKPRRAILFEGPPGTGKTYLAKAMAREAGVPFLFVSSSAFQSMFYGQTNRKIRSYFRALRTIARREGGAVGFIEEIDAIGATRGGAGSSVQREGISGVVNELLIQLQSFDLPPASVRVRGWLVEQVNKLLPAERQWRKPSVAPANFLVIGATNRAADLDPALIRPGRFDRTISFDLPSRAGRREIIDYYLSKKAHEAELDLEERRDSLAAMTFGYSPVMIEHLLDESLVWALRGKRGLLGWTDLQQAKMTEELGLAQPVEYTEAERRTIATHESGHATVAWLVGKGRKLEVLSIIKRRDALGLLAHSESEERYLKGQSDIEALIDISLGGIVAEELFFGETSSGAASDLKIATSAAAQIVGSLGMAGTLFSWEAVAAGPTGPSNLVGKLATVEDCRERVEVVISKSRDRVRVLIERNRHVVEALRDALLDRDELIGEEILEVIQTSAAAVVDLG